MFGPKIPVVAAAVGFALSFLTGLFSGAAFPVFLFRAILMALLFAALAGIVSVLIHRFLPELLESSRESPGPGETKTSGSVVDLTVGETDEDPVLSFGKDDSDSVESGYSMPSTEQERFTPESTDSFVDEELESVNEEVTTKRPPAEPPVSGEQPVANTDAGSDSMPKGEPLHPEKPKPRGGVSGLDVLPDLQDFIPEEKPGSEDDDDELPVEPVSHGFSVPDVTTDGVETETMAKAIRTILSKDN